MSGMVQKPKLSLIMTEYNEERLENDRISDLIFKQNIKQSDLQQKTFDSCIFKDMDFSQNILEKCAYFYKMRFF